MNSFMYSTKPQYNHFHVFVIVTKTFKIVWNNDKLAWGNHIRVVL